MEEILRNIVIVAACFWFIFFIVFFAVKNKKRKILNQDIQSYEKNKEFKRMSFDAVELQTNLFNEGEQTAPRHLRRDSTDRRSYNYNSDSSFVDSAIIGAVTGSALIGTLGGGDLIGASIGASFSSEDCDCL